MPTADALGNQRVVVKNIQGKVARVTEPDGGTVANTYDAAGNKTAVSINGTTTSTMQYDVMGNKVAMNDRSMGNWTYQYNAFGELVRQTDAKQQETTISYDAIGRVTARTSEDENSRFSYDTAPNAIGKLVQESSGAKTVRYSYDELGRADTTRTSILGKEFEQSVEYDQYSRPAASRYPGDEADVVINRNYSEQGYLQSISMPKDQIWTPDLLGLEKAMQAYASKIEVLNKQATEYEEQAHVYIRKATQARQAADRYLRTANWQEGYADRLLRYARIYDSNARYWTRKAAEFRSNARKYYSWMGNSYMRLVGKYSNGWVKYYGTKKRGKKRYRYTWHLKGFFSWNAWPRYLHVGKLLNQHAGYYDTYAKRNRVSAANNRKIAARYDQYAVQNIITAGQLKKEAAKYYTEAEKLTTKMREVQDKIRDYQGAVDTLEANLETLQAETEGDMVLWAATSMDASDRLSGQVYGNGVLTRRVHDPLTGRVDRIHSEHGDTQLRDLRFEYNQADSVTRRHDLVTGLDQNYRYDVKDQLVGMEQSQGDSTTSYGYGYDSSGNMTWKSNVGSMTYDSGNRLTSLTRNNNEIVNYQYDANGNQTSGNGRNIEWTVFNKASRIVSEGMVTRLHYGANHERVMQSVVQGNETENTYYAGGGYEYVTDTRNATEKYRINLYAGGELLGVYIKTLSGGNPELDRLRYFHKDALGNVDMITDIDGNVVARQSYSPFGMREQNKNTDLEARQITNYVQAAHQSDVGGDRVGQSITEVSVETNRGFTGHEHLDNGLVNMNARLYDPETGRFLSADIYIQEPNLLLSHNRYIYVMNNPMKYTDPSGHFANFIIGAIISYVASQSDNPYIRTVGMIVGGAMMGGAFGGETLFANAAMNNVATGFVMGGISGGDLESAVRGAISAGITYGIGHGANGEAIFGDNIFATATAHGVVQGIIAEAGGGDFASGFAAGFIGSLSGEVTDGIGGDGGGAIVARTTVASMFGGMAAKATGGSFEDGAFQAAMVHLFNKEAARAVQNARAQVDWDVFEEELTKLEDMSSYEVFKNEAGFTHVEIQKFKLFNACATRVSLALGRAGAPITSGGFNPSGVRVITSVHRLHGYLTSTYGTPDTSWSGRGIVNYRHPSGAAASNHISGGTGTVSDILYYSPPDGATVSFWNF